MDRHETANGGVGPAKLFIGKREGKVIPASAAVFWRQRPAQEAELAHTADQLGRHPPFFVHLAGDRDDLFLRELASE